MKIVYPVQILKAIKFLNLLCACEQHKMHTNVFKHVTYTKRIEQQIFSTLYSVHDHNDPEL